MSFLPGLYALALVAAGVEVVAVDGKADSLAILVDGLMAVGLGFAAEELRRGAADHEALGLGPSGHRQCHGQCGLICSIILCPLSVELAARMKGGDVDVDEVRA